MMEAIEFLKSKLHDLKDSCPYLNIKYEYRGFLNAHIIDIRPQKFFDNDKNYIKEQIKIEDEFELIFPDDEILFISEESLTHIESPLLELHSSEAIESIDVTFDETLIGELFESDIIVKPVEYYHCVSDIGFVSNYKGITNDFELPKPDGKPPAFLKNLLKFKGSKTKKEPFFI